MIVLAAPLIADGPPGTDVTLLDGFRIRIVRTLCRDHALEASLHVTVVSEVFRRPEGFGLEVSAGGNDVHPLGHQTLKFVNEFRVEAELEDCSTARLSREFCVGDFVGPVSEIAGGIDA